MFARIFLFIILLNFFFKSEGQILNRDSLLNNTILFNIKLDSVRMKLPESNTLILLASQNACSKCFEVLENYFSKLRIVNKLNFVVIIRIIYNPLTIREYKKRYHIFTFTDNFYYDFIQINKLDNNQIGLFYNLGINKTPAIILASGKNFELLPYDKLFNNLSSLSYRSKKKIKKFLKVSKT